MTTKTDIIAAIQGVADATGDGNLRIAIGAPGDHVENSIGETQPTGDAWEPEPKTWPVVVEGIAAWLDSKNVGGSAQFNTIQPMTVSGNIVGGAELVVFANPGITGTLPLSTSIPIGRKIVVKNVAAAPSSIATSGGETIDGAAGPLTVAPMGAVRLVGNGVDGWWTW